MADTSIDILTSPTLKHLRERWWDDEFTEFLAETLRPVPGNRILDVGCGEGLAEVAIGRLRLSQIRLVGVDLSVEKVIGARRETLAHNQRAAFAAGDAVKLPFLDGVFDSTYCVAVLQHIPAVEAAVAEFARVTRAHGRVLAVEPDNAWRYAYSSVDSGAAVFEAVAQLHASLGSDRSQTSVGPRLPGLFARCGIQPVSVRVFPVALTFLGAPDDEIWHERRRAIDRVASRGREAAALASVALERLERYEADARQAGAAFVEIQNTLLFATVGQRREE